MGSQKQFQNHPPVVLKAGGIGPNDHPILGRGGAGGDQVAALILHHAHPAGAIDGQIGIITEGGNMDSYAVDDLEDVFFLVKVCPYAVNYHIFSHFVLSPSI